MIYVHRLTIVAFVFFFFNDTATTEIYPLSLHDALPISVLREVVAPVGEQQARPAPAGAAGVVVDGDRVAHRDVGTHRSEEHTSELQSRQYLVCRLLLEKKKK